MKVVCALVGGVLWSGCSGPARKPVAAPAATPPLAIRATAKVPVACGPDYLPRHATSVSDLDGDGTLDRVGITREADGIVVRLYQLPSLHETASWKLAPANGYLELATPRRRDSTRGDLWITVGAGLDKPWDGSAAVWTETLYHLDGGALAPVTTGYRNLRIGVDVDGDGRVDPIGEGGAVRALVAGDTWLELPVVLASHVHGVPVAPTGPADSVQEEAADLDGNGVRELVLERDDRIAIVEVPSLREVWSARGKPWQPSLVRWGDAYVLVVRLDDMLRIYKTDSSHELIAEYPGAESYADVVAALDGQIVMYGHPIQFFDRATPGKSIGTIQELVGRLDAAAAPFGPLRLAPGDAPGLVAIHQDPLKAMEVELVDPMTRVVRRTVWRSEPISRLDNDVGISVVDLDRDGTGELLLDSITRTVFHHGASWNTSRFELRDGAGRRLWQEPDTRIEEWVYDNQDYTTGHQTRVDGTHVRAFDLGDGTMPLRVRSVRDEYYLLPAASKLTKIPPCLE